MHLVADFAEPLAQRYDDVTAAEIVARRGINAQPLSMYYAERTTRSSFVLGYACADEAALDATCADDGGRIVAIVGTGTIDTARIGALHRAFSTLRYRRRCRMFVLADPDAAVAYRSLERIRTRKMASTWSSRALTKYLCSTA